MGGNNNLFFPFVIQTLIARPVRSSAASKGSLRAGAPHGLEAESGDSTEMQLLRQSKTPLPRSTEGIERARGEREY